MACGGSSDKYEPAGEVPFTEDDLQEVAFERSNNGNATIFESIEDQISVTVPDSALPESVNPDDLTSEAVYVSSGNAFAIDFTLGPDGTEFEEKVELSWVGPWDPSAVIQIQAVSDDGVPVLTSIEDTEEIIENLVIAPSESGDEARYSLNVDHYSTWTVSVYSRDFDRSRNGIRVFGEVSFGLALFDERDLEDCFFYDLLDRVMIDFESYRLCMDALDSHWKAEREAGASRIRLENITGEDVAAIAFASGVDLHGFRWNTEFTSGVWGRTCQKIMIPENSTDIRFITSGDTQVGSLNTPYDCVEPTNKYQLQDIARYGDVMLGTTSIIPMVCASSERGTEEQEISGHIINFSTYFWDSGDESPPRESSYRRMISLFLNLKDDRLDMERDTDDEVSAGQVLTGQEVSDNFANFLTILPFSVELLCKAPEPDPTPTPEPTQTPEPEDTGPPPAISRTNVFLECEEGTFECGFDVRLSRPPSAPVDLVITDFDGVACDASGIERGTIHTFKVGETMAETNWDLGWGAGFSVPDDEIVNGERTCSVTYGAVGAEEFAALEPFTYEYIVTDNDTAAAIPSPAPEATPTPVPEPTPTPMPEPEATPTPMPEPEATPTPVPEPQAGDWKENDMVTCEWQGSPGCGFYYSGDPFYVDVGPVGQAGDTFPVITGNAGDLAYDLLPGNSIINCFDGDTPAICRFLFSNDPPHIPPITYQIINIIP